MMPGVSPTHAGVSRVGVRCVACRCPFSPVPSVRVDCGLGTSTPGVAGSMGAPGGHAVTIIVTAVRGGQRAGQPR
jgi:hypothetical protein